MRFLGLKEESGEKIKEALSTYGDVIELGVLNGSTTWQLAEAVRQQPKFKKVYACDTFEGLPYTDTEDGVVSNLKKGELKGLTIQQFVQKITTLKYVDIIVPIGGLFEDTLLKHLAGLKFCLAWLDADLYTSTKIAYLFLENRMAKNGIIGFHDYGHKRCPGVTKVVNSLLNRKLFEPVLRERSSIFFRKI